MKTIKIFYDKNKRHFLKVTPTEFFLGDWAGLAATLVPNNFGFELIGE